MGFLYTWCLKLIYHHRVTVAAGGMYFQFSIWEKQVLNFGHTFEKNRATG